MRNYNNLSQEIETRREYYKKWRDKNKDKIKKHNETFWKKQAEKLNTTKN